MAAITSASVSIPSFTGLKSITTAAATSRITTAKVSSAPMLSIKASSLKDQLSAAAVATATSALLLAAAPALAAEVLLGSDDGGLAFVPNAFSVAAGEKITFKNNAGFPHNVVFDEDEIPSGVDAAKISMSDEDLLNAPGETYSVTLTEKGTYKFYCSPHQGAGMSGQVTVN